MRVLAGRWLATLAQVTASLIHKREATTADSGPAPVTAAALVTVGRNWTCRSARDVVVAGQPFSWPGPWEAWLDFGTRSARPLRVMRTAPNCLWRGQNASVDKAVSFVMLS